MASKFIDNTAIILRRMDSNCQNAMKKAADAYVEAVQKQILYGYKDVHGNPPHTEIVETGRLFDSIEAVPQKVSQNAYGVTVGTNVKYASYVHDGTSKLKGRPFIKDGVMGASDDVKNIIASELPNGIV